ncbi:MAG TPA: hypothetical protein VKE49_07795 [Myxococcaceae bacterium]|nr:hypothetical protein [Myxococcaceae bacterium]
MLALNIALMALLGLARTAAAVTLRGPELDPHAEATPSINKNHFPFTAAKGLFI